MPTPPKYTAPTINDDNSHMQTLASGNAYFCIQIHDDLEAVAIRHRVNAFDGLVEALAALVTAVTYADPPKEFNGVLAHEARVPVEFIQSARAALKQAKEPAHEG